MIEQLLITPSNSSLEPTKVLDGSEMADQVDIRLEIIDELVKTLVSKGMVVSYLETQTKQSVVKTIENWLPAFQLNMEMKRRPSFEGQEYLDVAQQGAIVRLGVLFEYFSRAVDFGDDTPPFGVEDKNVEFVKGIGDRFRNIDMDDVVGGLEKSETDGINVERIKSLVDQLGHDWVYVIGELCRRKVVPFMGSRDEEAKDVKGAAGEGNQE